MDHVCAKTSDDRYNDIGPKDLIIMLAIGDQMFSTEEMRGTGAAESRRNFPRWI